MLPRGDRDNTEVSLLSDSISNTYISARVEAKLVWGLYVCVCVVVCYLNTWLEMRQMKLKTDTSGHEARRSEDCHYGTLWTFAGTATLISVSRLMRWQHSRNLQFMIKLHFEFNKPLALFNNCGTLNFVQKSDVQDLTIIKEQKEHKF